MKLILLWTILAPFSSPERAGFWPLRGAEASQQGADSPARESRTPETVLGTMEERAATASAHYANNRPLEAALGFEGLLRDFPQDVRFLFNAAASRHAAGHHAHAVAYTREYLERGKPRGEAKVEADAQLREALAEVIPVQVTLAVAPGGPGQVTLVAQHVARDSGDVRPELLFPAPLMGLQSSLTIELDPGVWTIRAEGTGYGEVEQRLEVTKGVPLRASLQVPLASETLLPGKASPREVPPALARKMKLGFGIGGGIVAAAGIGVTVIGGIKVSGTKECTMDTAKCPANLAHGINTRDYGVMALGAGLGLVGGGVTWAMKDPSKRRKAWIAQSAVGGAALLGGFIALFFVQDRFYEQTKMQLEWGTFYGDFRHSTGHAFSTAFFGLGGGLLTSAVSGLAVQHKFLGNIKVNAFGRPGEPGLAISGRF